MRILFTHAGGSGHLMPLIPFARAAMVAGHEVGFIAQERTARYVKDLCFPVVAEVEPPDDRELAEAFAGADALPTLFERVDQGLRDVFAGIFARQQIPAVLRACDMWQPNLIVRDEADFGSAIAAELAGIPCVTVLVVAAGSFVRSSLVEEPLNALRSAYGLSPDPKMQTLEGDLTICPFPPSFRDPDFPLPANAVAIRPDVRGAAPTVDLPKRMQDLPDRPVVYFSLGTVYNTIRQDLFGPVIEGLRDLPLRLIVTVGRDVDVNVFGSQPPNVHIEQFIPQYALLPSCDLVISHAGSGSLNGAFAHGLPVIVIPLGADQPYNARRCAQLGVGEVIGDTAVTPDRVQSTVATVLGDHSYREQAERLRDEIAGLPGSGYAVSLFDQLVA